MTAEFLYDIPKAGKFYIICPVIINQQRELNNSEPLPPQATDSRQQTLFNDTQTDGGKFKDRVDRQCG